MDIRTGTLREDIRVIRPGEHGRDYLIFDPATDLYYKVSPLSALMISKLDRDYELKEFAQKLQKIGLDVDATDVAELIGFLSVNNLLAPQFGQFEHKLQTLKQVKDKTWLVRFASIYMCFRLPAIHPEKIIAKVAPFLSFWTSRYFIWPLLLLAGLGFVLALRDFSAVRTAFLDSLSWAGLVKYFIAIVVLKIIHESSHILTAAHFGCRVRAIGISFIFLYPRFFTDTTDSWLLARHKRLLIDAGGLIGEIICGGIAALVWSYLPPGTAKSTAFYVFAVSTMSTLLVNGNPFIRFDGYYILCDLLGIDNFMSRATEYTKQLWRYCCFHLGAWPQEERPVTMVVFGVSTFIYRIFLYTSIILVIYNSFVKVVAVVMLFLEVFTIFLLPMHRELKTIHALSRRAGGRANWTFLVLVLVVVTAVLFLPLSWSIVLPGELSRENSRLVTVVEGGFLESSYPENQCEVRKNEKIVQLNPGVFIYQLDRTQAMLQEEQTLFDLQQSDRETYGDSMLTWQKLTGTREALTELQRRLAMREIKAEVSGTFIPRFSHLSPGVYLPPGTVLGEIVSGTPKIRAYATDREVKSLQPGQKVALLFRDRPGTVKGTITAVTPIPARLRHSPLLIHFGGEIPVYPDEKNPGDYLSVQALYPVEIQVDEESGALIHGRTLRVKVLHREVLASGLWKLLVAAFRREF